MLFLDLSAALVVAALITAFAVFILRWRHPMRGDLTLAVIFLFSVVFMTAWAGGVWLGAGRWAAFLFIGAAVLLLVKAISHPPHPPAGERREIIEAAESSTVFNWYFWTFVVLTLVAVIVRYATWNR